MDERALTLIEYLRERVREGKEREEKAEVAGYVMNTRYARGERDAFNECIWKINEIFKEKP